MDRHDTLSAELQSLEAVPRDFAAVASSESQARRDLADDERRLEAAKKAMDNAITEVDATSKTSRRVSGLLTGKSREYKRQAELADRTLVSAQEKHATLSVVVESQKVSIAEHVAKLTLLEEKVSRYSEIAGKLDALYEESLGPFEFPANDILTTALRTAQGDLEHSEVKVLIERETAAHLGKALQAINRAVEEVARGNGFLGNDNSANSKVADAYRNAQNLAHEFRAALREAHIINGAVTFAHEILIPRPPIRSSQPGGRLAVDSSTDGLVWEQAQKSYKRDVLLRDLFRSDEIARAESRLHAAESRVRQARSALLIVEQTVRERRRQIYEKRESGDRDA